MSLTRYARIIAVLVFAALAVGCDVALRLSYNQGTNLLYWWLDGYVDVTDEQAPRVRQAIDDWFRWHRSEQLPEIARLLQQAQRESVDTAPTPQSMCAWVDEGRRRARVALDAALPSITGFARTLSAPQVAHMERKFAKSNEKFRDDHLQRDADDRREAAFKRVRQRAELMYGRLDRAQRDWLQAQVAASPYDAVQWDAERHARQRDIVHTLQALRAAPQWSAAQAQQALAALGERLLHSPRPAYRAYQQALTEYNCAMAARLHQRVTPAQRRHAHDKLARWEDDVRALMDDR